MRMRKRDYIGSVIYLIYLDIRRPFRKIFGYCDYCKRYFLYPNIFLNGLRISKYIKYITLPI